MEEYRSYKQRDMSYDPAIYSSHGRAKRSGAPASGNKSFVNTPYEENEQTIKIYVTLKKEYEGNDDYKKLSIMTRSNMYISELKRRIEKEFVDLFPTEPPYIVAKLEDDKGFSLSNGSVVGEFLQHGDRIYAQPESLSNIRGQYARDNTRGLQGGGNSQDLLEMLKNLQTSIVTKLVSSDLRMHEDVEDLLKNLICLGFSTNSKLISDVCTIISRVLTPFNVQVYDKETNRNIQDLTILLIQYWLNEMCNYDTYLMTQTVLILENLVLCPAMWEMLKGSPIVTRLLSLSKSVAATGETKSKIIKIISSLTRDVAPRRFSELDKYEKPNSRSHKDLFDSVL